LDRLVRTGAQGADVRRERSVPDASRTLVIGKDETWFAYEGREVSLRKTHTLRRVFGGLLAARAKGAALGVDEVFSVGWPGERVAASSATNRVYVSANFSCLEVGACKAQPALDRRDDADLARIIAGRRRRTTRGLVFERDPGPHVAPGWRTVVEVDRSARTNARASRGTTAQRSHARRVLDVARAPDDAQLESRTLGALRLGYP
jgi:hypothetical protein